MEHVSCTITIVQLAAVIHHVGPTSSYAATAKGRETEEEYEERTDDEDRSLDS
ncbi:Uncharacterised protein [Segatella copri]|nr:Uncharacterised protein [Segatella copri]